jgi:hypothetical protein
MGCHNSAESRALNLQPPNPFHRADGYQRAATASNLRSCQTSSDMAHARARSGLVIVAALAYPILLLFVLAPASSPLNINPSWGLAAEHGELGAEQRSQFLEAVIAASPLAVAFRFTPRKVGYLAVHLSSLPTALLYAVQPTHQFSSNTTLGVERRASERCRCWDDRR